MIITTQRLVLKPLDESHTNGLFRIRSNGIINQYLDRIPPKDNFDALNFILMIKRNTEEEKSCFWVISQQYSTELIGTICFYNFSEDRKSAEVGFELLPEYHKKGLMSEALSAVLDYGFNDLHLQKILAFAHQNNKDSCKILLKHEFIFIEYLQNTGDPQIISFTLNQNLHLGL